ncbi:MAG: hypothetical protein U0168_06810 [Nannocystaceae bacterium]
MSSPRPYVFAAALAVAIGPLSCQKKKDQPGTDAPLVITGTPAEPTPPGGGGGGGDAPATRKPKPAVQRVEIDATLTGVGALFDFAKEVTAHWGDEPLDVRAQVQAALLQTGFAPSFLDNLDLVGTHAAWFSYPQQEQEATAADVNLAATIAVVDARKLIESAPAGSRPQPLGDGMWEIKSSDARFMLKEAGKELLVGMSPDDLRRAAGLRNQAKGDHRFTARVSNIPKDELDPFALLGLPDDNPVAKRVADVLKNIASLQLTADVGVDKDGVVVVSADAPFSKLGIEPLGKPRAAATAVEAKLPGNAMFVTTMSWGDPKLVQSTIDHQVPLSRIPEPFLGIVKQALGSVSTLLQQVANDVVVGLYVDAAGKMTIVVAADVKNDDKTRDAMRGLGDAVRQAVEAQQTLAGKNVSAHIGVEWKPGGVPVTGGKADRLAVKAPKDMAGDLDEASFLLAKNTLEVVTLVQGGVAVLAVGPGAKALVGDVAKGAAKPRKDSLAQHQGLDHLRTAMGGCQICAAFDISGYLRFRLALLSAKDKTKAKDVKKQLAALKKAGSVGSPSFGVRVAPKQGAIGAMLPRELLFASKSAVDTLKATNDFVEDGSLPPPPPPVKRGDAPPPAKKSAGK